MLNPERIKFYLLIFGIAVASSYVVNKFKIGFDKTDDYELIRKYLLNDSPLYGYNRPKIWIHSKYELNSRKWKDFQSRNTTDLNQPYLHSTIKTIINHCGNDFNICLIDDESFSKLLPMWDVDITKMAEPMKSHFRELAMMEVLYYYGGMIVPNSFLCMKNLISFYNEGLEDDKPFVCESIGRNYNQFKNKHTSVFCPDNYFMGSKKNDETLLVLIEFLKKRNKNPHFQGPLGETNWLIPGILLVGSYPAPAYYDPVEADIYIMSLLQAGIDTFVCLNDEYGKNPDHYAYAELEGDDRL
jgi:hypothetical protein